MKSLVIAIFFIYVFQGTPHPCFSFSGHAHRTTMTGLGGGGGGLRGGHQPLGGHSQVGGMFRHGVGHGVGIHGSAPGPGGTHLTHNSHHVIKHTERHGLGVGHGHRHLHSHQG